jgi:hypothetical protein
MFENFTMRFFLALFCGVLFAGPLQADAPHAINSHYRWCGEAKTQAEKIQRYEGFWAECHPPKDDEYDDQPHITYVRKCAYRLVELYAQTGQKDKCLKMLAWLETTDRALPENEQVPPKKK